MVDVEKAGIVKSEEQLKEDAARADVWKVAKAEAEKK